MTLTSEYKALISDSRKIIIDRLPTPNAVPGTCLVKPLFTWIPPYTRSVFTGSGTRTLPYPSPLTPGITAVGRVAAIPIDTAVLKIGDLVVVNPQVHARDDPIESRFMFGWMQGFTASTEKLAAHAWRHGTYAEIVAVPLENVLKVNEPAIQRQGIKISDLAFFTQLAIPYGGLRDIGLSAGETVVIAPATGHYGGAAVHVALAMGARVIAAGRRHEILEELKELNPGRVDIIQLDEQGRLDVGDLEELGPVDAFLDFSPSRKTDGSILRAAVHIVRTGGRISIMGSIGDIAIPFGLVMLKNITLRGTNMHTRAQAAEMVRMIEHGILKLGRSAGFRIIAIYPLQEWSCALEAAEDNSGAGRAVLLSPNTE